MGTLLGSPQRHTTTMNTFLYFSALVASSLAAPQQVTLKGHGVPTLVRAPAHDSASIEHHRLGGNFAYSTAEAHAFASVTPQISTTVPVAGHAVVGHAAVGHAGYAGIAPVAGYAGYAGHP